MRKHREFFAYVIPSVFAFALSGVYAIVDGFFIGNSIGDEGLAAINIAYPVTAFLLAIGTGIGMGGAIQYSLHFADKNADTKKHYFSVTVIMLLIASLVCTILFLFLSKEILIAFGADGNLLTYGYDYLKVVCYGSIFQMLATGLVPLIRNMGGSVIAMLAMIVGFFANIILDYLLVWVYPYGLAGAALATIIGQGLTMLVCIGFFIHKKSGFLLPAKERIKSVCITIVKGGLSPFGLTFSPNIVLIIMNKFSMIYGGDQAVTTYAAIAYINTIILLLLQGVGDGSQPLLSRQHGEDAHSHVHRTGIMAYKTAGLIAIACMITLFFLRDYAAALFGASAMVRYQVANVLPFFLVGFPLMAYLRITTSWFYATEKNNLAYLVVYGEPILLLCMLFIFPSFMGLSGVWLAVPLTQLLTVVVARLAQSSQPRLNDRSIVKIETEA